MKDKTKELEKKMHQLKIFDKDIKEKFIKSSGPGGQNVNKVSTCVHLIHVPSGIEVKCQEGRTQAINRLKARYMLVRKIEEIIHLEHVQATQAREKEKRQKRKRPSSLQEEVLEAKHKLSDKKEARKKIRSQDLEKFV